jgi:hypothetical protein
LGQYKMLVTALGRIETRKRELQDNSTIAVEIPSQRQLRIIKIAISISSTRKHFREPEGCCHACDDEVEWNSVKISQRQRGTSGLKQRT